MTMMVGKWVISILLSLLISLVSHGNNGGMVMVMADDGVIPLQWLGTCSSPLLCDSTNSYGTIGVTLPTNHPGARTRHAMAAIAADTFIIYGGYGPLNGGGGQYNGADTWMYESGQWTWIAGPGTTTSTANYALTSEVGQSDAGIRLNGLMAKSNDGSVYLYGGGDGNGYAFSSMWRGNVSSSGEWLWYYVSGTNSASESRVVGTLLVEDPTVTPGSNRNMATSMVAIDNYLYTFGGQDYLSVENNIIWRYNTNNNQWTWLWGTDQSTGLSSGTAGVYSTTNGPSCRISASLAASADGKSLYMFGGYTDSVYFSNEIWQYSLTANQWAYWTGDLTGYQIPIYPPALGLGSVSSTPGGRWRAFMVTDASDQLYLIRGSYSTSGFYGDIWKWTSTTNIWLWISGSDGQNYGAPSISSYGILNSSLLIGDAYWDNAVMDPTGTLYIFGGLGSPNVYYGDLYSSGIIHCGVGGYNPNALNTTCAACTMGRYGDTLDGSSSYLCDGACNDGSLALAGSIDASCGGNYTGVSLQWLSGCASMLNCGDADIITGAIGVEGIGYTPGPILSSPSAALGAYIFVYAKSWDGNNAVMWAFNMYTSRWAYFKASFLADYSFGIGQAATSASPGARQYGGMVSDGTANLWLFGGDGEVASDAVWSFDTSTYDWTWRSGGQSTTTTPSLVSSSWTEDATNTPGAQVLFVQESMVYIEGYIYFWYGYSRLVDSSGTTAHNVLWRYSTSSLLWAWMTGTSDNNSAGAVGALGESSSLYTPSARVAPCMTASLDGTAIYLFGGGLDSTVTAYNDIWKYDIASNGWAWIAGTTVGSPLVTPTYNTIVGLNQGDSSSNPGGRVQSTLLADGSDNLWLFAGRPADVSDRTGYADIWVYNLLTSIWSWVAGCDQMGAVPTRGVGSRGPYSPGATSLGVKHIVENRLFLIGGSYADVTPMGEVYISSSIDILCGAGTYKGSVASDSCTDCPAGRYSDTTASFGTRLCKDACTIRTRPVVGATTAQCDGYDAAMQLQWLSGCDDDSALAGTCPIIRGTKGSGASLNQFGPRLSPGLTSYDGILYFWGGLNGDSTVAYADGWTYNPTTDIWTWIFGYTQNNIAPAYHAGGTNTPGGRGHHGLFYYGNGTSSDSLWLFGGYSGYQASFRQDVWQYKFSDDIWYWRAGSDGTQDYRNIPPYMGVENATANPGSQSVPQQYASDGTQYVYMFGGIQVSDGSRDNLLWRFNTETYEWAWLSGDLTTSSNIGGAPGVFDPSYAPGSRSWHGLAINHQRTMLYMTGGLGPAGFTDYPQDVWAWSIALGQWSMLAEYPVASIGSYLPQYPTLGWVTDNPGFYSQPGGRLDPLIAVDVQDNIISLAGIDPASHSYSYTTKWRFDTSTYAWSWIAGDRISLNGPSFLGNGFSASKYRVMGSYYPAAVTRPAILIDSSNNMYQYGGRTFSDEALGALWSNAIVFCDVGYYRANLTSSLCIECPSGRYGNETGLAVAACSGACDTNTFELPASTDPLCGGYKSEALPLQWWQQCNMHWNSSQLLTPSSCRPSWGIKGVPSSTNIMPPRLKQGHIIIGDTHYIYGGMGTVHASPTTFVSTQLANDLWSFSSNSSEWTWLHGSSYGNIAANYTNGGDDTTPGARYAPQLIHFPDDADHFWLWGGGIGSTFAQIITTDIWKYDIAMNQWTYLVGRGGVTEGIDAVMIIPPEMGVENDTCTPVPTPFVIPSSFAVTIVTNTSSGATTSYIYTFENMATSTITTNTVWRFNIDTLKWAWIFGDPTTSESPVVYPSSLNVFAATNTPGARSGAAYAINPSMTLVYCFGGSFGQLYLDELWSYSIALNQWSMIAYFPPTTANGRPAAYPSSIGFFNGNSGVSPGARLYPRIQVTGSSAYHTNGEFIIFYGGVNVIGFGSSQPIPSTASTDFWAFSINTQQWNWVAGTSGPDGVYSSSANQLTTGYYYPSSSPAGSFIVDRGNNLWMFGGVPTISTFEALADLWSSSVLYCAAGTYKDMIYDTSCTSCPAGRYGAYDGEGCPSVCAIGTASPVGATACTTCSSVSLCPSEGTAYDSCKVRSCPSQLNCTLSDTTNPLSTASCACATDSCYNGGTCTVDLDDDTIYTCSCATGFAGPRCEYTISTAITHEWASVLFGEDVSDPSLQVQSTTGRVMITASSLTVNGDMITTASDGATEAYSLTSISDTVTNIESVLEALDYY